MPPPSKNFSLGVTALSLRPELARIMADTFSKSSSWHEARSKIISSNAFQARTTTSASRIEIELRRRLSSLTPQQVQLLAAGSMDIGSSMAWLSVLKTTPFVFMFTTDILRQKLEASDCCLRRSDYEDFFSSQASMHPFLAGLSPSTKTKVRSVLCKMLRDIGILTSIARENFIQRPVIPTEAYEAILADDPRWLAGFLVPDADVANLCDKRLSVSSHV